MINEHETSKVYRYKGCIFCQFIQILRVMINKTWIINELTILRQFPSSKNMHKDQITSNFEPIHQSLHQMNN